MGTDFDDLEVLGSDAEKLVCGAGHPQTEFQTKDLDGDMWLFFIHSGRLYRQARGPSRHHPATMRDGNLILTREAVAEPVPFTGEVAVYTHCADCEPVYFVNESRWGGDHVVHREPWVEYSIELRDGELTRVKPIEVTTREEIKQELAGQGVAVLADDDPIVRGLRERRRRAAAD